MPLVDITYYPNSTRVNPSVAGRVAKRLLNLGDGRVPW